MKTHGTFNTQYNKKYVLFFVNEGTGYGEVDGLYQPISEPLYAIYNDYGTFEFEEESLAAFNRFKTFISTFLVEMEQGENEYHDIPVNKELFNEEYVFRMMHEDRFFIKTKSFMPNESEIIRKVKLHVVDREYFDGVIENFKINSIQTNFKTIKYEDLFKMYFEKIKEYISFEQEKIDFFTHYQTKTEEEKEKYYNKNREIEVFSFFIKSLDLNGYYFKYFKNLFKQNHENLEEIVKEVIKYYVYQLFIEAIHHDFFPMNYGGQETDMDAFNLHIKLLKNIVKTNKKLFDE